MGSESVSMVFEAKCGGLSLKIWCLEGISLLKS